VKTESATMEMILPSINNAHEYIWLRRGEHAVKIEALYCVVEEDQNN
jgi:hypothetical protein